MSSIHELVSSARQRFLDAGIHAAEAELDGRVLAERLLRWDAAQYFAHGEMSAPEGFAERYHTLVERRLRREPVAYIIGEQEFWNLSFEVTPAVLIPRPETELIVETALSILPGGRGRRRVADCCTGSGCLAVALAREQTSTHVVATDVSHEALLVARRNVVRHGVTARVSLVRCSLIGGLAGPFDMIVANPPYVPDGEKAVLQPEVVDYEPPLALFAGSDGLSVIRQLVEQSPARLAPGGRIVFEFGFGQAEAVTRLIEQTSSLDLLEVRNDLQGIPRVAVATRAEA